MFSREERERGSEPTRAGRRAARSSPACEEGAPRPSDSGSQGPEAGPGLGRRCRSRGRPGLWVYELTARQSPGKVFKHTDDLQGRSQRLVWASDRGNVFNFFNRSILKLWKK